MISGYMGNAIEYYIFKYTLTHIDLKIFKHSFLVHWNSKIVVINLNIKIQNLADIVPTLDIYIQGRIVVTKTKKIFFSQFCQEINSFKKEICMCVAKVVNHQRLTENPRDKAARQPFLFWDQVKFSNVQINRLSLIKPTHPHRARRLNIKIFNLLWLI